VFWFIDNTCTCEQYLASPPRRTCVQLSGLLTFQDADPYKKSTLATGDNVFSVEQTPKSADSSLIPTSFIKAPPTSKSDPASFIGMHLAPALSPFSNFQSLISSIQRLSLRFATVSLSPPLPTLGDSRFSNPYELPR